MLCKIWGIHGGDYKECQIRGFHGGDYEGGARFLRNVGSYKSHTA
jgi:hypothetical protein